MRNSAPSPHAPHARTGRGWGVADVKAAVRLPAPPRAQVSRPAPQLSQASPHAPGFEVFSAVSFRRGSLF